MKLNHLHLMVPDVPAANGDESRVDELHARLRADGFDAAPPRREHACSFHVSAPGGVLVEVGA
jgi:hypothetical protein